LPGQLAGPMGILSHHARHVVAAFLSGRNIVVGLLIIGVVIVLLVTPVIGGSAFDSFSAAAEKGAPAIFLVGAGVLVLGLVTGVFLLDAIGLCLIGAVMVGWLLINY
jgi:hypothetical protein